MTRLAARVSVVAALLGAGVPARSAERVVFCENRTGACAHPKKALGTSPRGSWALVDDQDLRAAAGAKEQVPPILYLSRSEYEGAVAGLNATERGAAVLQRLKVQSSRMRGTLLEAVHDDLLALAAATAGEHLASLDPIVGAMVIMAGGPNYHAGSRPDEAVNEIRTSLAKVLVELPPGPATDGYRREDGELARLEAAIKHLQKAGPAPFASPERAYFLPGAPHPEHRDPLFLDMPWYGWRGGTVQLLQTKSASEDPWRHYQPRAVYLGRDPFLRDVLFLTDAQMDRRLRARLVKIPEQEEREVIESFAIDHARQTRQYAAALQKPTAGLPSGKDLVAADTENLRLLLIALEPGAAKERPQRLARLAADVALAGALLPHSRDPVLDLLISSVGQLTSAQGVAP